MQVVDGKERTIAYESKKLLPRERNWSIIEKELGAIGWSFQKFENYVYAREIEVQTDHKLPENCFRMSVSGAWLQRQYQHNSGCRADEHEVGNEIGRDQGRAKL